MLSERLKTQRADTEEDFRWIMVGGVLRGPEARIKAKDSFVPFY